MERSNLHPGYLLICALLAPLWLGACASSGSPTAQGAAKPATQRDIAARDNVLRARLDNGLQVVIVDSDLAPVVTTRMNYRVGSNDAPEGFPGMAHAVEHMMFRGSPGLSGDQLKTIAARLGADTGAFTGQDLTQYQFTVPRNDLGLVLRIEALRMRALDITPQGWRAERGAIEQEVAGANSDPGSNFFSWLVSEMFRATPYAHTAMGTKASFDATTAEQLHRFYRQWYVPNNAVLVISGDVDPQQTLDEVKSLFGDIPSRLLPARASFDFQPVPAGRHETVTPDPAGNLYMTWRTPGLRDDESAALQIMIGALGSPRGRLAALGFDGAVTQAGIFATPLAHAGLATVYADFPAGVDPASIRARLRAILNDAARKGIDPELVAAAKRQAIAAIEEQRNSVTGMADIWSEAIIERGLPSPQALIAQLEAVTPSQVDALAARLFDPQNAIEVAFVPAEAPGESRPDQPAARPQGAAEAPAAEPTGHRDDIESFGGVPLSPVALPAWAERALAEPDLPVSTLDPVDMRLDNGLRLIVQPKHASGRLTLMGAVRSNPDIQTPAGEEGVAELLDGIYRFGSRGMDRVALRRAFDEIGADERVGSNFSLSVSKDAFGRGVELLADHLLEPDLSARAFSWAQAQLLDTLPGRLYSPRALYDRTLDQALLPPGDPALRHATVESVKQLTAGQVGDYFQRVFRPDMTVIVVVGDIDPQRARAVIEQAFGDWRASGERPEIDYPAVPNHPAEHFSIADPATRQAKVALAEMLPVDSASDDRFALLLGNEALSGDYASLLWRQLRTERGLVYEVSSNLMFDTHRARFEVRYASDPARLDQARELTLESLARMRTVPLSDAELERARSKLLRGMPLDEISYRNIAGLLLSLALDERPLDERLRAAAHFRRLDAAAVQAAWQRYLRPNDLVTGIFGPAR